MESRLKLQILLESILENRNVYYQPPSSIRMSYPAIVYSRNNIDNYHADNSIYKQEKSYNIIVIDEDPDSDIVDKISKLPKCRFNSHYVSDNLNHDSFTLYF